VAAELAAHRLTVRRLLDRHGIRRLRRTAMERAASKAGRRVQAVGWQARRAARLTELGFADVDGPPPLGKVLLGSSRRPPAAGSCKRWWRLPERGAKAR